MGRTEGWSPLPSQCPRSQSEGFRRPQYDAPRSQTSSWDTVGPASSSSVSTHPVVARKSGGRTGTEKGSVLEVLLLRQLTETPPEMRRLGLRLPLQDLHPGRTASTGGSARVSGDRSTAAFPALAPVSQGIGRVAYSTFSERAFDPGIPGRLLWTSREAV